MASPPVPLSESADSFLARFAAPSGVRASVEQKPRIARVEHEEQQQPAQLNRQYNNEGKGEKKPITRALCAGLPWAADVVDDLYQSIEMQ